MKKHVPFYLLLVVIPFMAYLFISFSNGAPLQGVTGSPGDEANASNIGLTVGNCIACHDNAANFNATLSISTNIPSGGYELSKTYAITVSVTSTALDNGFQITAENGVAAKVGVFTITDAVNTKADGAGRFVTHTFASHEGVTSWSFNWTAPSADVGVITFYAASVAGSAGAATNTQVVFTSKTIGSVLAVNDNRLLQFSMFPNPSDNYVTLQLPSDVDKVQVSVFDYLGKALLQKSISSNNNTLDISNLSAGIYFVRIQSDSKVGTKKLVVR